MAARKSKNGTARKPKPSPARKCRLRRRQQNVLNFEALEPKQLLAGVTVGNALDLVNAPDLTSISALINNDGGDGISLREAITAANNTAGSDSIDFAAGAGETFENGATIALTMGQLEIADEVTIDASAAANNVVIDAQQNSRVMDVSASAGDVSLNNLTIRNGQVTDVDGAGIRFLSGGTLTLNSSNVENNSALGSQFLITEGGGVYLESGTAIFDNSTISNNSSIGEGGGVFSNTGPVTITNSSFINNIGRQMGGGGLYTNSGNINIYSSIMSGNTGGARGGAVNSQNGNITIQDSELSGNLAGRGGGLFAINGDVNITNSNISGNQASTWAGGVYAKYGNTIITNSVIRENTAVNGSGGIDSENYVHLISTVVSENQVLNGSGGGIGGFRFEVRLTNSIVTGNTAASDGGGIVVTGSTIDSQIYLVDSTVSGNVAGRDGGGISASGSIATDLQMVLVNSTVSDNVASRSGGGIKGSTTDIVLVNSTVSDNAAGDEGGGVFALGISSGSVSMFGSTISDNTAADVGGGISTTSRNIYLSNSTIQGNNSGDNGGGIYTRSGQVRVSNSTIVQNSAMGDGGGIGFDNIGYISSDQQLTLQNSIVALNTDSGTAPDFLAPSNPGTNLVVTYSLTGNNIGTTLLEAQSQNGAGNFVGDSQGGGVIDPLLVPLADSGGTPPTLALIPGSLALDSGSDNLLVEANAGRDLNGDGDMDDTLTEDQRGLARVVGSSVDMGAFERQSIENMTLVVSAISDIDDGNFATGQLSLREAIGLTNLSSGADNIVFEPGLFGGTISLDGSELEITDSLSINASSLVEPITIDAGLGSRILNFTASSGDLHVSGLTLSGGRTFQTGGQGAGVRFASSGTASFDRVMFNENRTSGNFADGGAVAVLSSSGDLSITNSTFTGNRTLGIGSDGGAIFSAGDAILTGTTFSENSTVGNTAEGGAVYANGDLSVLFSTFSGNASAGSGGAIALSAAGNLDLADSILLGNFASGAGDEISITGSLTFAGTNLVGADAAAFDASVSVNVQNADPTLVFAQTVYNNGVLAGVLANNGGPVDTIALRNDATNPAIDIGGSQPDGFSHDAAGNPRAVDFAGVDNGGFIDAGAFEVQNGTLVTVEDPSFVVTTNSDVVSNLDNVTSLREAILLANSNPDVNTITFDNTVFNGGANSLIRLQQAQLTIAGDVTIDGSSGTDVIITADAQGNDTTLGGTYITDTANNSSTSDNSRVLSLTSGTVGLIDLTITGGFTTGDGAGIHVGSDAVLNLDRSTISGNHASSNGDGGGLANYGTTNILNSTVSHNQGRYGGGVINSTADVMTITNSAIFGNEALNSGGGVSNFGIATLTNVTVSGNSTMADGGGVHNSTNDELTLNNVTIANNSATALGGGVNNRGTATLNNTIVAGNIAGGDLAGLDFDGENNLIQDGSGTGLTGTITGDPLLGPLQDNGGSTLTHALSVDSPAFDAGNVGLLPDDVNDLDGDSNTAEPIPFDQRGAGFDRIAGSGLDIGAYEFNPGTAALNLPALINVIEDTTSDVDLSSSVFFDGVGNGITVILTGGTGTLAANSGGGVSVTGSGTTELQLTGDAGSINAFFDNVSNVRYTSALNLFGFDVIDVAIDDGTNPLVDAGSIDVSIAPVDDVPQINGVPGEIIVVKNTPTYADLSGFTVADVDGDVLELTFAAGSGIWNAIDAGGVSVQGSGTASLVLTGSQVNINAFLNTENLQYVPQADLIGDNSDTISVSLFDGTTNVDGGTIDVDIVEPESLLVTVNTDVVDAFDGETSLREAITFANRLPSASTITFDGSIFDGIGTNSVIRLAQGELAVSGDITIDGTTGTLVLITGDANDDDVTLAGTDITDIPSSLNANTLNDNSRVLLVNGGNIQLNNLVITGGATANGGGIYVDFGASLDIQNSEISGNYASAFGGGINNHGTVSMTGSTVSGNRAVEGGGGINNSTNDTLLVIDSDIISNTSSSGGGISNYGTATLTGSTVSQNQSLHLAVYRRGGGIFNQQTLFLNGSTLSENYAIVSGGGLYNLGSATLLNTTLSGNMAIDGGAIGNLGTTTITNSTLSGNFSSSIDSYGGGAIHNLLGTIDVSNSILLGNAGQLNNAEIISLGGVETFHGHNIVGADSSAFDTTGLANVQNADPNLVFDQTYDNNGVAAGVLADNGGTVQTIALKADLSNPALDAGQNDLLDESVAGLDLNGDGDINDVIDIDARGFARIDNMFADLGAYELNLGPQVESVVVNGGDAQRSMVTQITVTFSEIVTGVDANSFILMNTTTNNQIVPTVTTQVVKGKTVATLTFGGAGIIGGSLADGDYTLTTLDTVIDAAGNQLDGDNDGTAGGNAMDDFFRYFGDVNGDRTVNIVDLFQFRQAFNGSYNAAFDYNGDGVVNIIDLFQFRVRFGTSL